MLAVLLPMMVVGAVFGAWMGLEVDGGVARRSQAGS